MIKLQCKKEINMKKSLLIFSSNQTTISNITHYANVNDIEYDIVSDIGRFTAQLTRKDYTLIVISPKVVVGTEHGVPAYLEMMLYPFSAVVLDDSDKGLRAMKRQIELLEPEGDLDEVYLLIEEIYKVIRCASPIAQILQANNKEKVKPVLVKLLEFMYEQKNTLISIDELLKFLWKDSPEKHINTFYAYIHEARELLPNNSKIKLTREKKGYYMLSA